MSNFIGNQNVMIEDDRKTLWCGNLSEQVTEELLYELFLQAGPLEKVKIPKDRVGRQKNFAFVTYCHEVSVPYAMQLFRGTSLFHRTLTLQSRGKIVSMPPPIRSVAFDQPPDFQSQANFIEQFTDMTDKLKEIDNRMAQVASLKHDFHDKLSIASLKGNWSHRHHPYRSQDHKTHNRDEYRSRDIHSNSYQGNSHHNHQSNWRDRRNYKKGNNFHRRD